MVTSANIFKRCLLAQLTDLKKHCRGTQTKIIEKRINKICQMAEQDVTKEVFVSTLKDFIKL